MASNVIRYAAKCRVPGRPLWASFNRNCSSNAEDPNKQEKEEENIEEKILQAALPFVHVHGWSSAAIAEGASTLGYSPMINGMFPNDGLDLVNFFFRTCNAKLEDELIQTVQKSKEDPSVSVEMYAFIKDAVQYRLRFNGEYIDKWSQALALHASPTNLRTGFHNYGTLIDHIWYYAGDRSHDAMWYQKRLGLGAIYKSTELCMLQDKSEDFQETWSFLERRLENMKNINSFVCQSSNNISDLQTLAKAGVLTAINILGLKSKSF